MADASAALDAALFNQNSVFSDSALLEQYKLYLQLLDRITDRRQNANSFFLSINTAVGALLGYFFTKGDVVTSGPFVLFIPLLGLLLSYFWYRLVRSYATVNSAKFQVVCAIEKRLPIAPYAAEWQLLSSPSMRYVPITFVEVWVPRCFMLLYGTLLLYLVAAARFAL